MERISQLRSRDVIVRVDSWLGHLLADDATATNAMATPKTRHRRTKQPSERVNDACVPLIDGIGEHTSVRHPVCPLCDPVVHCDAVHSGLLIQNSSVAAWQELADDDNVNES